MKILIILSVLAQGATTTFMIHLPQKIHIIFNFTYQRITNRNLHIILNSLSLWTDMFNKKLQSKNNKWVDYTSTVKFWYLGTQNLKNTTKFLEDSHVISCCRFVCFPLGIAAADVVVVVVLVVSDPVVVSVESRRVSLLHRFVFDCPFY